MLRTQSPARQTMLGAATVPAIRRGFPQRQQHQAAAAARHAPLLAVAKENASPACFAGGGYPSQDAVSHPATFSPRFSNRRPRQSEKLFPA